MSAQKPIKFCSVMQCPNTSVNSAAKFFRFPKIRGSEQRRKWIHAVKSKNGAWWSPSARSVICSEHFKSGELSLEPDHVDHVPSVFTTISNFKCRDLSLKQFALEYIKNDVLLDKLAGQPGAATDDKRCEQAYLLLGMSLGLRVPQVVAWERRLRHSLSRQEEEWVALVQRCVAARAERVSGVARRVVLALCAAARARGVLCSTGLYNDVRRALRLSTAVGDLHAVWVSAQRVSLAQVVAAGRAGDSAAAAAPQHAARVADLVLLHTDVDMHRLVTDESVSLYAESAALHTLWQLVQRHALEREGNAADDDEELEYKQRWTRAHADYLNSGRVASLILLQRRWHELKLQALDRLAVHWRRGSAPLVPLVPPAGPPLNVPRPAPIHLAILKRYPHIVTSPPRSWRQLVLDGAIVIEPQGNDKKNHKKHKDEKHSTSTTELDDQPTGKQSVETAEQHVVADPLDEVAKCKVEPTVADNTLDKKTADDDPLTKHATLAQPKIEDTEDPLAEQHAVQDPEVVTDETIVKEPKVEKPSGSDLLVESRATFDRPADSSATCPNVSKQDDTGREVSVMRDVTSPPRLILTNNEEVTRVTDTPGTDVQPPTETTLHLFNDIGDVTPRHTNLSESDSEGEDKLVIDEYSNKTPSVDTHTQTHEPAIQVLHMIDPSTVKTEILFESDDDDFEPSTEQHMVETELNTQLNVSSISNRLVFDDEVPSLESDVTHVTQNLSVKLEDTEDDKKTVDVAMCGSDVIATDNVMGSDDVASNEQVTENMDTDSNHKMQDVFVEVPPIDPKLLMETSIRVVRVDSIRAWKKNVRKNQKTIRVSRIKNHLPAPPRRVTSHEPTELAVTQNSLERVANTSLVQDLCREIKREYIDEPPNKRSKTESDSDDDQPLLMIKKIKEGKSRLDLAEDSSDDEFFNSEMLKNMRGEDRRIRTRSTVYGASTIQWSPSFGPPAGNYSSHSSNKRVTLRDIEQVRRDNSNMQVAQVAPITNITQAPPEECPVPGAADLPQECTLSLPSGDELLVALDELSTLATAEQVLETSHCCAARRHRVVNDTRRRIGFPEIPLHNHPDGACTCCCAHLCDEHERRRLDEQLAALHHDIARMLRKMMGTKKWIKKKSAVPAPKSKAKVSSRSPSPVSATSSARSQHGTKDTSPSNNATDVNTSKAKTSAGASSSTNKQVPCSSSRPKPRARKSKVSSPPPPPAPDPTPVSDLEEWQRQKTMNAQYFHISRNTSKKTTAQTNNERPNIGQTNAPVNAAQTNIAQTNIAPGSNLQVNTVQTNTIQTIIAQINIVQTSTVQINSEQTNAVQTNTTQTMIVPNVVPSDLPPLRPAPGPRRRVEPRPDMRPDTRADTLPDSIVPATEQTPRAEIDEPIPRHTGQPLASYSRKKPELSILEEYSRTLTTAPGPAATGPAALGPAALGSAALGPAALAPANALSLQLPTAPGVQGPTTTVLMALTLPADQTSSTTSTAGVDLAKMVGSLIPPLTTRNPHKLYDGDVIELDDSDSDHSDQSASEPVPPTTAPDSEVQNHNNLNSLLPSCSIISDNLLGKSIAPAPTPPPPSRAGSSLEVVMSLADESRRCTSRCADPHSMPHFMQKLRKSAAASQYEIYQYKTGAPRRGVSRLPCGGAVLCVDASRAPLMLHKRSSASRCGYLVLTDAELPCVLPTYWTLAGFKHIARIVPDELGWPAPPEPPDTAASTRGTASTGCSVEPHETKLCEKSHEFKILTAFCSADGVRLAARAGAALMLLQVATARLAALTVTRRAYPGAAARRDGTARVTHHASADVDRKLLQMLEKMLNKAENWDPPRRTNKPPQPPQPPEPPQQQQ